MKNSRILASLIILQILTQAVFAQQEPQQQQAVQQEPQQIIQQEPQQLVPQEPQQIVQQEPQQMVQQEPPQQAAAPQESGPPANIITLDLGPTIIGFALGAIPVDEMDFSAFGFAVQYERQLFERLSIAGRFAYLGSSIKYEYEDDVIDPMGTVVGSEKFTAKIDLSSFSLEAHPRVYPFGGSFFLDGMLGYADMSIGMTGKIDLKGEGKTYDASAKKSLEVSRGYFKYGGKLGWRADFGEPGGFIFEHSYGYYGASPLSKTFGKQLSKEIEKETGSPAEISKDFDDALKILEDWLFVGGIRVTFAFGWRF